MPVLPGVADLGPAPNVTVYRPAQVGGYDTTGLQRGQAALARGAEQLGAGIERAGQDVAEVARGQAQLQVANAHSNALAEMIAARSATAQDPNYGPTTEGGKGQPDRFADTLADIRTRWAATIDSPAGKQHFASELEPHVAESLAWAQDRYRSLSNNAEKASTLTTGDNLINKGAMAADDSTHTALMDAYRNQVDALVTKGTVTPVEAVAMKRDFVSKFNHADVAARVDRGEAQGALDDLRASRAAAAGDPTAGGQYVTNRILQNEGTDKNARSSATGAGQFIDSTWLEMVKKNRPDLADGRSDTDILALRADKDLGRQMTEAYRAQNEASLKNAGVQPTPGNHYLAHFLGPAGAIAVAQADPKMPVGDALAKAVGPDKAKAMIAANPTVLAGQLAGSVTAWADSKMGGGGHRYEALDAGERDQLIRYAEGGLAKQTTNDLSDFRTKLQDSETEAARTGNVVNPIAQSEFISRLGAVDGPKAYENYKQNLQLGLDAQSAAQLAPDEQRKLLDSYEPQPGAPGYAEQLQRQEVLAKAIDKTNAEKKDPASFAIQRLPASGDAWKGFAATLGDPTKGDDERQAAARKFATTTTMEQGKIGIPAEQQAILPKSYVEHFNKQIASAADSDDPQKRVGLIGLIKREAAMWGDDNWPAVMRQLAPTAQPIVRAIAAGADETAMTRLLGLDKKDNPAELLKQQSETKAGDLNRALSSEFQPLLRSMVGRQKDRDYTPLFDLGQKLAALHVRDGDDSSTAAAKAFNELIGAQYDFKDTFMIPKQAGVSPEAVHAGSLAVRSMLPELGARAPLDDMPGRTNATKTDLDALGRDATFVSEPHGTGLNLVYNDKFVRGPDGKNLTIPWGQLAAIGNTMTPRHKEALARRGVYTAGPFGD